MLLMTSTSPPHSKMVLQRKPSIKAAMAANVGSCLFLYNGLLSISPQLFAEAALQHVPATAPQLQQKPFKMGCAPSRPSRPTQPKTYKQRFVFRIVCTGCEKLEKPCAALNEYLMSCQRDQTKQIAYKRVTVKPDDSHYNLYELPVSLCGYLVKDDTNDILNKMVVNRYSTNKGEIDLDLLERMLWKQIDLRGNPRPPPPSRGLGAAILGQPRIKRLA